MASGQLKHAGGPVKILVFVDLPDGELDDYGKGILSEASRLAKTLDAECVTACFDGAMEESLQACAPYGAEQVVLLQGPANLAESIEVQGRLIASAAKDLGASLVLLPHNDVGGALAPLIAAELDAALFVEGISYSLEQDQLKLTRAILGCRVAASKTWDGSAPLVLSIHANVLSGVVLPSMKPGKVQVSKFQPASLDAGGTTRIIERIPPDPQTVDVSEAEVMVSAGLGCDAKGFGMVEDLTRLLNASLGVTRPCYDLGYTGFERMVGQTGKTVAPRFYLALGISGSMHHLGGIKDSKRIVSINIDSKAPIFPNSDEGFVADLREVLPLLIEKVKSATGGAA